MSRYLTWVLHGMSPSIVGGSTDVSVLFCKGIVWLSLVWIFIFQLINQSLFRSMCSCSLQEMIAGCLCLLAIALSSMYRATLTWGVVGKYTEYCFLTCITSRGIRWTASCGQDLRTRSKAPSMSVTRLLNPLVIIFTSLRTCNSKKW